MAVIEYDEYKQKLHALEPTLEDTVVGVIFPGHQRRQTPVGDLLFDGGIALRHIVQQGGVVLLLAHLAHGQGVLPVGHQLVVLFDLALQALNLLGHPLGALDIVPKAVDLR